MEETNVLSSLNTWWPDKDAVHNTVHNAVIMPRGTHTFALGSWEGLGKLAAVALWEVGSA